MLVVTLAVSRNQCSVVGIEILCAYDCFSIFSYAVVLQPNARMNVNVIIDVQGFELICGSHMFFILATVPEISRSSCAPVKDSESKSCCAM